MDISIEVDCSGPIFDGRAEAAAHASCDAIRHALAEKGEQLAFTAFTESIKVDRGIFTSHFTQTDESKVYNWLSSWTKDGKLRAKVYTMPITVDLSDETVVTNELATYGPWLEGTGSRNITTRFKGYFGMVKAAAALNSIAEEIGEEVIKPFVEEMND